MPLHRKLILIYFIIGIIYAVIMVVKSVKENMEAKLQIDWTKTTAYGITCLLAWPMEIYYQLKGR